MTLDSRCYRVSCSNRSSAHKSIPMFQECFLWCNEMRVPVGYRYGLEWVETVQNIRCEAIEVIKSLLAIRLLIDRVPAKGG